MKAPLRDELLQVFRGLRMYSAHEFSLGGGPRVDSRSRGGVLPALTLELYRRCYLRPGGEPAPPPDTAFAQRLWEAGFLPPKWDFGWSVYQRHPDGEVSVRKADCYRLARPGEYALSGPPGSPPGSEVALRTPQPFFDPQTGFLWLTGQTPADDFDDRQTVRIYFHLRARFAAALAGGITRQWNRYQVGPSCTSGPTRESSTWHAATSPSRPAWSRRWPSSCPGRFAPRFRSSPGASETGSDWPRTRRVRRASACTAAGWWPWP